MAAVLLQEIEDKLTQIKATIINEEGKYKLLEARLHESNLEGIRKEWQSLNHEMGERLHELQNINEQFGVLEKRITDYNGPNKDALISRLQKVWEGFASRVLSHLTDSQILFTNRKSDLESKDKKDYPIRFSTEKFSKQKKNEQPLYQKMINGVYNHGQTACLVGAGIIASSYIPGVSSALTAASSGLLTQVGGLLSSIAATATNIGSFAQTNLPLFGSALSAAWALPKAGKELWEGEKMKGAVTLGTGLALAAAPHHAAIQAKMGSGLQAAALASTPTLTKAANFLRENGHGLICLATYPTSILAYAFGYKKTAAGLGTVGIAATPTIFQLNKGWVALGKHALGLK